MTDDAYLPWVNELLAEGAAIPMEGQYRSWSAYLAWVTKVENMLVEVVGPEHVYYLRFHGYAHGTDVNLAHSWGLQQLVAFRDDLSKGRVVSQRSLIAAEVFADFLDMAEHLLNNGYKDPAASLIGAVLERGLRDIAVANDVKVRSKDDLTSLANRLAEKGVYNRLVQKNLDVWIAVRNHADHGEFSEFSVEDVRGMYTGVSTFLSQHSPQ